MNRKQWYLFAGLALVAVLAAGYWLWLRPAPQMVYREVPVARGDIVVTVQATGTVRPRNRLEIKPPLAGRIEEVLVQEGKPVRKGEVLAWMSSNERAALLDAARARGTEEVSRWAELYRPTAIIAPITGTVILRNVEPGQSFTTADAVLVIADRLIVEAQVDETDIGQVRSGQDAVITLDSYPAQAIAAQVAAIAFEAKTVSNVTTYTVDVLPREVPPFMRSGMTTSVLFHVARREGVLRVPGYAVTQRDGKAYVLRPGAEGAAPHEAAIEAGLSDGKWTEVLNGLGEGDRVLVTETRADGRRDTVNPFTGFGRPRQQSQRPAQR